MLIIIAILLAIIASTLLFGAHATLIVLGILAAGCAMRAVIDRVGLAVLAGLVVYLWLFGSIAVLFLSRT